MSDLTAFRDHARLMAEREHAAGCPPVRSKPGRAHNGDNEKWCGETTAHSEHLWNQQSRFGEHLIDWACHGICGGCLPDHERTLWRRLADEIDAYLADDPEVIGQLTPDDQPLEGL